VAKVTFFVTVDPATTLPTSLMEFCSTVRVTVVPGVMPCRAEIRAQSVGVGVALTAVITWATCSVSAAGEPGAMP